jgi:SAM-dependent methyltransferase
MGAYYRYSRSNIVQLISSLARPSKVLEVGCGLGQVCRQISESGAVASVAGLDISTVAVERARRLNPGAVFYAGDFAAPDIARQVGRQDIVIFNQLLWYVLDRLPRMLANAREVLNDGGHLLVCNAFLREPQRFGREIVDGFDGLIRYLASHTEGRFRFVRAHLHRDPELIHDDGYVLMETNAAA